MSLGLLERTLRVDAIHNHVAEGPPRYSVAPSQDDVDQWLREGDPGSGVPDLKAVPVSEKVNSPRNDGPELIEVIEAINGDR